MSSVAAAPTLRAAALPRAGWLTTTVLLATGVVALAASAQAALPLPFTPVPLTLQTLTVLLLGAAYGPRLAAGTFAGYLALGMAGAPVFSLGRNGAAIIGSPTLGYLVGMLAATVVVGMLARRAWDRSPVTTVLAMVVGNVVIYAGGVAGLLVLGMSAGQAIAAGVLPFLLGDAIKIAAAAGVLPAAWALLNRFKD